MKKKTNKTTTTNKQTWGGGEVAIVTVPLRAPRNALSDCECLPLAVLGKLHNYLLSWTKLSADTFEQSKCFLAASFHNFNGYNIEKGRGARNVKIGD